MVKNLKYLLFAIPLFAIASWEMDFDDDFASASTTKPDVLDGLIAWWKMDEASWNGTAGEAFDSISTNTAKAINGAITTNGLINRAGLFDGSNDAFLTDYVFSHGIGTGSFSWSAWINPKIFSGTPTGSSIMANGTYAPLLYLSASGALVLYSNGPKPFNASVTSNQWSHVVMVRTSGVFSAYINGIKTPTSQAFTLNMLNAKMCIGSHSLGVGGDFFSGTIDDVRIYNRALSSNEVNTIYQKFKP